MSEKHHDDIGRILRNALPPMAPAELQRDLWPHLLRRLDERTGSVPWFDWALIAVVALGALISPQMIPILLYHL